MSSVVCYCITIVRKCLSMCVRLCGMLLLPMLPEFLPLSPIVRGFRVTAVISLLFVYIIFQFSSPSLCLWYDRRSVRIVFTLLYLFISWWANLIVSLIWLVLFFDTCSCHLLAQIFHIPANWFIWSSQEETIVPMSTPGSKFFIRLTFYISWLSPSCVVKTVTLFWSTFSRQASKFT